MNYSSTINGKHAGAANILPDHHIEDHYNVGDGDDNDDRDTDKIGIFDGTITISVASVN